MAEEVIRWVSAIARDRLEEVGRVLADIDADPAGNDHLPFGQLPMVHFASVTVFDDPQPPDDQRPPNDSPPTRDPLLVIECNIDRPFTTFVSELVRVGRRGLDAILAGTEGYPGPDAAADFVVAYLCRQKRRPQLYHIGHPGRSVQEIRGDYELRRSIIAELASKQERNELSQLSPADIVKSIRATANCPNQLKVWKRLRPWHDDWSRPLADPPAAPTRLNEVMWLPDEGMWDWIGRLLRLYAIAWLVGFAMVLWSDRFLFPHRVSIGLLILIAFAVVRSSSPDSKVLRGALVSAILGWLVDLPFKLAVVSALPTPLLLAALVPLAPTLFIVVAYLNIQRSLAVTTPRLPLTDDVKARVQTLLEAEDQPKHSIYNHVAGLSALRDDYRWLRICRTWLVLRLLNLFYRTQFVKGKLVTIPSIHFAQWSLVGGRHLLFVTNYEGGADSYLDDFFNSLANGVAFIWHDTKLFPRTTDPRRLKTWVREGQTLASVRYRASVYNGLTVGAINSNTYIRERLLRGRGQASARRWLARFATNPEEPTIISRFAGWVIEQTGVGS